MIIALASPPTRLLTIIFMQQLMREVDERVSMAILPQRLIGINAERCAVAGSLTTLKDFVVGPVAGNCSTVLQSIRPLKESSMTGNRRSKRKQMQQL